MDTIDLGKVECTINQAIATISFMHPAGNSLPSRLLTKIVEAFDAVSNDDKVSVVVLKSAGDRAFCGGASFDELLAIQNLDQGKAFFMGFAKVINAMRQCPKIVVVRVQGKAVGGGVGLAAAADYCMASKYASVKLSELTIGIGPFVISPAVERKIGLSAFSKLAINASEWQTAEWAKSKGLFHEVFQSTEQLDAYLEHFCNQLKTYHPKAMQQLKATLWKGTEHWEELLAKNAEISGSLVLSEFTKNALKKFRQK